MVLYGRNISYEYAMEIYKATKEDAYSEEKFEKAVNEILKVAQEYKLSGDCFCNYIAWLIINDENPFSIDCEMKKTSNKKENKPNCLHLICWLIIPLAITTMLSRISHATISW